MAETPIVKMFDKCANYSVMTALVMNTINSMKRFSGIPKDKIVTQIYDVIKRKASGQ